jgi:TetR/AcrR family transcriptional repressor of nem operon
MGANFDRCQSNSKLGPLQRFRCYFEELCARLESQECRHGCPIGNLCQELADQSEAFRNRLEAIFETMRRRYAACLKEAQEAGEIPARLDVDTLAEFCLCSWQGAILRAKAARSTRPIRTFIDILFGTVLCDSERNVRAAGT